MLQEGPYTGCHTAAYQRAARLFESLRTLERRPKSSKRLKEEAAFGFYGRITKDLSKGFWISKGDKVSCTIWAAFTSCRPNAALVDTAAMRCSNQTSNAYNISICPLASTTPPPLLNATILTFSSYDDGCSPRVYFPGWGARLYGNVYDEMYVCTNGHIDFGPAAYPYVYNSPIPVTLSDSDIAPMVAPFMADLYDVQGYSTISVSFEGTAPNRYAIVRWNQVKYYGSYSLQNNNSVTFDTVFYESGASYDVKYYNIDDNPYLLTSGGYYGIGNENNDEGKSWSVLSLNNGSIPTPINYLYFSSTSVGNFSIIRNALSGYSTRWTFTGIGCRA